MIRDSYYYTVIDQAYVNALKTVPIFDLLPEGTKATMNGGPLLAAFEGITMTRLRCLHR